MSPKLVCGVVTQLCLEVLKAARRQRETYVGPWLPEPVVDAESDDTDDVTSPLMMASDFRSTLRRLRSRPSTRATPGELR